MLHGDLKYRGPKASSLSNTTAPWGLPASLRTIIKMPTTQALTPTPTYRCKVETTERNSTPRLLTNTIRAQRHVTPSIVSLS